MNQRRAPVPRPHAPIGTHARPEPIYIAYAAQYDAQGQAQWGVALAHFTLDTLLPRYCRRPRTALDLACGTGAVALVLAGAGMRVLGLDRSRAMLRVARAKGAGRKGLSFVCADLRAFAFAARFDLITCCYDSLNYLTDPAELRVAFGHVRDALTPDGLFICDLVTARAFEAAGDDTLDLGAVRYSWSTTWDAASRQALTAVTWTTPQGDRTRSSTEFHRQRAYERPEVAAALVAAGLRPLGAFAGRPFNEPTLAPPDNETRRIIYIAERTDHG